MWAYMPNKTCVSSQYYILNAKCLTIKYFVMKVGSLVVCVDDTNWAGHAHRVIDRLPVKGKVYQVRRIFTPEYTGLASYGVGLEGISGRYILYETESGRKQYCECHFRMTRFAEILPPLEIGEFAEEEIGEEFERILTEPGKA